MYNYKVHFPVLISSSDSVDRYPIVASCTDFYIAHLTSIQKVCVLLAFSEALQEVVGGVNRPRCGGTLDNPPTEKSIDACTCIVWKKQPHSKRSSTQSTHAIIQMGIISSSEDLAMDLHSSTLHIHRLASYPQY